MRTSHILLIGAALSLAACGEDQAAQAPGNNAPAQPGVAQTAPAAPAQPAPNTVTTAPPVTATPPATNAPVTTAPPATAPTLDRSQTTGSVGTQSAAGSALQPYMDRTFAGGPVRLTLAGDSTFTLNQEGTGRSVQGRYAYVDGVVTFLEPRGETGGAQFPMRCRMEAVSPTEFRLTESDGTCRQLANVSFRAAQ